MTQPTDESIPQWASNTNWSTGPLSGTATKQTPTAPQEADGFVGALSFKGRLANYVLSQLGAWQLYMRDDVTAIYGDGSDGAAAITGGTTTLTRDMYYTDLTVEGTGILETAGFRVFCNGTLQVDASGIIQHNGADAVLDTAGTGAAAGSLGAGGDGAAGVTGTAVPGTQAAAVTNRIGGAGGAGGASNQGDAGGAAQTGTLPLAAYGGYRHLQAAIAGRLADDHRLLRGGVGGSSGGLDDGGASGGGGGGGGVIVIAARTVILNGTIQALGGDGGDGDPIGGGAGEGGGGGGGGGVVYIVRRYGSGAGSVLVTGGTEGDGTSGGAKGVAGSVGFLLLLAA